MKCESVQQDIPLYIYGELTAPAEESFEEHVTVCSPCAEELKKYRTFSDVVSLAVEEPPVWLLAECRQSLSHRTQEAPKPRSSWKLNWDWLLNSSVAFKIPVSALALLALGFFGGRLIPGLLPQVGGASPQSGALQAGFISNIKSVQPDSSGHVQIDVDETRRRVISGTVQDPEIRRLLLTAMHEESNPGVRVDSMTALKDHAGDANVRQALLDAVVHDPNPGVRMRALDGLKSFDADPEIRKTLSQVLLTDANPGVRMLVIDLLTSQKAPQDDESLVRVLQQLVQKDDNSYVQQKCQRVLQDRNASVGTF